MWKVYEGSDIRRNYMYELILFNALLIISLSSADPLLMEVLIIAYKHVHNPI